MLFKMHYVLTVKLSEKIQFMFLRVAKGFLLFGSLIINSKNAFDSNSTVLLTFWSLSLAEKNGLMLISLLCWFGTSGINTTPRG